MGDFVFIGIVFLLLVVFREQLLAALVGGGRNSGFIVAPLDDGDFTVRTWQVCALLSPGLGKRKSRITFSVSCLGVPLVGGGLFIFLMGCQFVKLEVISPSALYILQLKKNFSNPLCLTHDIQIGHHKLGLLFQYLRFQCKILRWSSRFPQVYHLRNSF